MQNPEVPSPIPPWQRTYQNPQAGGITTDGTINLLYNVSFLSSNSIRMVGGVASPYQVVLPNGNYPRQTIQIYNNSAYCNLGTSATFQVSGQFAAFRMLTFNNIGFSAVLFWDGNNWILTAGNAIPT